MMEKGWVRCMLGLNNVDDKLGITDGPLRWRYRGHWGGRNYRECSSGLDRRRTSRKLF